ncbi:hypothetical protein KPL74_17560 [Bacillus sp. NP157]|nr:hypothetical protein KPL74_17560 [Bacillus sp. NP157]
MTITIKDKHVIAELETRAAEHGRTADVEALYILQSVIYNLTTSVVRTECQGAFGDRDQTWLLDLWNDFSYLDDLSDEEAEQRLNDHFDKVQKRLTGTRKD